MPVDHYENFPVASWLLPRHLRAPVVALYRFARSADDIADEGDAPYEQRLRQLDAYRAELDVIAAGGHSDDPLFCQLAEAVRQHDLPVPLLRDAIDWKAGFHVAEDDAQGLMEALDELAARWRLRIDWGLDDDAREAPDTTELLQAAFAQLREHHLSLWTLDTGEATLAGWITRRTAAPAEATA